MASPEPSSIPVKQRLLLAVLGLIGMGIVLLATSRYGAGLSPDSVHYVGTARNLISDAGFLSYDGSRRLAWPPLYPTLLALWGRILAADPLSLVNVVNAVLFGLIVYLGGLLAFKHLSSSPVLALAATLSLVFSEPLFEVAAMAWSEPLFICLMLLSLLLARSYRARNDGASLWLFSSAVALSFLTRYIGITLVFWGALIILAYHRGSLNNRIAHLASFGLISTAPLALWLFSSYVAVSTPVAPPASSAFTLSQNITFALNGALDWYIPASIAGHCSILILVIAALAFLAALGVEHTRERVGVALRQVCPIATFALIYTAFLVVTSTTSAYDQIDNRLLSPIYVPLTLFLLVLAQALFEPYHKGSSMRIRHSFLLIGIAVWLVYPIRTTLLDAGNVLSSGRGYSSKAWVDSQIVQYLLQHPTLASECTIYTNGPDAAYILANLTTLGSPARTRYNSPQTVNTIPGLEGTWPEEGNACLIWFDKIRNEFLFTVDELRSIAAMDPIVRLADGAVYSVTRE